MHRFLLYYFSGRVSHIFLNWKFGKLQGFLLAGRLPEKVTCYDGVFYNYFSIGKYLFWAFGYDLSSCNLFCMCNYGFGLLFLFFFFPFSPHSFIFFTMFFQEKTILNVRLLEELCPRCANFAVRFLA